MAKQEVKIEWNGHEAFFFAHTFKTAMEHAEEFIERNRGKFDIRVFLLNESCFGERWLFYKHIKANPEETA